MKCSKCGTELRFGDRYCIKCGTRLKYGKKLGLAVTIVALVVLPFVVGKFAERTEIGNSSTILDGLSSEQSLFEKERPNAKKSAGSKNRKSIFPTDIEISISDMNNFMQEKTPLNVDDRFIYSGIYNKEIAIDKKTGKTKDLSEHEVQTYGRDNELIIDDIAFTHIGVIKELTEGGKLYIVKSHIDIDGSLESVWFDGPVLAKGKYLYHTTWHTIFPEVGDPFHKTFFCRTLIKDLHESGDSLAHIQQYYCTVLEAEQSEILLELNDTMTFGIYGNYILFHNTNNIWSYNIKKNTFVPLIEGTEEDAPGISYVISSDGKYVYFYNYESNSISIERIDFDGNTREILLSNITGSGLLHYADGHLFFGSNLYYDDAIRLYSMDIETKQIVTPIDNTITKCEEDGTCYDDGWLYYLSSDALKRTNLDCSIVETVGENTPERIYYDKSANIERGEQIDLACLMWGEGSVPTKENVKYLIYLNNVWKVIGYKGKGVNGGGDITLLMAEPFCEVKWLEGNNPEYYEKSDLYRILETYWDILEKAHTRQASAVMGITLYDPPYTPGDQKDTFFDADPIGYQHLWALSTAEAMLLTSDNENCENSVFDKSFWLRSKAFYAGSAAFASSYGVSLRGSICNMESLDGVCPAMTLDASHLQITGGKGTYECPYVLDVK